MCRQTLDMAIRIRDSELLRLASSDLYFTELKLATRSVPAGSGESRCPPRKKILVSAHENRNPTVGALSNSGFAAKPFWRAADEVIPYDGLPSPSKVATDKDVRRTSGRFLSAARLCRRRVNPNGQVWKGKLPNRVLVEFALSALSRR